MKIRGLAILTAAVLLAACSGKSDDAATVDADALAGAGGAGADGFGGQGAGLGIEGGALGQPNPTTAAYFQQVVGDKVFFETDQYDLDAEDRDVLIRQAAWLDSNPGATATIEGHADERGTREYNLALGARRAQAVRDFLVAQGVAEQRLEVVSFGKERPAAPGSDPASWAQNRRAVTVLLNTPVS